ncbi:MAG: tandem-95 repeat protein [Gammaproteobacteria bacterium]|nr:tandem-95 repeat protein [Gammaproteobacteria bacterium]
MLVLLGLPLTAVGQSVSYDVLIDLDRDPATGCVVTPAGGVAEAGFERRLRASVELASLQVTDVELAECVGSSLQSLGSVGGGYPVGLDVGTAASDVIELSVGLAELDPGIVNQIRLVYVADNGTGSDVLASTDGSTGGADILIGLPVEPVEVPTLGVLGLAVLIAMLLLAGWLMQRRWGRLGTLSALLLVSVAAWAMNFVSDGDVSDWAGIAPLATDPADDASDGAANVELLSAFAAVENNRLFLRVDAADLENLAPVANADAFSVDEDTALNVAAPGVLANDSDPETDPITAVLAAGPANAQSFTLNADGSFDYTPNADFNGSDSFSYFANDGQTNSAAATVTITVNAINDAPVAVEDSATTDEDIQVDIDVLANDSDIDGNLDPASVTVTTPPADGGTSVNPANGVITYTKSGDFNGADSFVYEVCDDGTPLPAQCATATVNITINDVNDAPTFTAGPDQVVNEDAGLQTINGWATGISAGPPDESGQVLTFNITGNDNVGLFAAGPVVDAITGDLSFTPADDANGAATITLTLSDDGGTANGGADTSTPASFTITVNPVNDPPSTGNDSATGNEDVGIDIDVLANDSDIDGNIDPASVSVTTPAANGMTSVNPTTGLISYTPDADFNGNDSFVYEVCDDGSPPPAACAMATVSLTINAVNDAPSFTAGANPSAGQDSGAQVINGWATGISVGPPDESGQMLTFNITGNDNQSLFSAQPAVAADGTLSFTPAAGQTGSANVSLALMDDGGTANGGVDTSPPQSFTITIVPVNSAPSFTVGADQNLLEDAGAQSIVGWASNISPGGPADVGQTLMFNITGNTAPALFSAPPVVTPDGTLSFTPAADANGSATITLELMDDGGTANGGVDTSPPQNFTITIAAVNDPPSFTVIGAPPAVNEDPGSVITGGALNISAGPADEAAQGLSFNLTPTASDSTMGFTVAPTMDAATGNLSYTPAPNAFGSASFSVVLMDDGGTADGGVDSSPAQNLTITLTPVNDPPTVVNHTLTTHSAVRITLGGGDSELLKDGAADVDDPNTALSVSPLAASSANGALLTLTDAATGTYRYDPPGGFAGNDSFSYEVCDSATTAGPVQCATGTVNVTVTGPALWVVNSGAAPGGDGSLNRPLQALSNLPGGRAAGARIFLASGNNPGGHNFVTNEQLIGQGASGNSFDGFLGVQVPGNGTLDARPAVAGTRPVVQGQVTLANGALARGFNIAPASGVQGLFGSGAFTGIDVRQLNVATVNATAVNLNGLNGLFFIDRVDANGGLNGIALNNFPSGGLFSVVGDGSMSRNGSGGTIQNTTGDGVLLINANNVSLHSMNLFNVGDTVDSSAGGNNLATNDHAVESQGGAQIFLDAVHINNPAAGGWEAVDLGGINGIRLDSLIENVDVSNMQALEVRNTNTDMTRFTIDATRFANQDATNGSSYVLLQSFGSSNMEVEVILGSLFEQLFGNGFQANANGTGTVNVTVDNSTFRDAVDGTVGLGATGGLGGIIAAASADATLNYNISNNTLRDIGRPLANAGVITLQGIGGNNKLLDGRFDNNFIDRIGYPTAATATGTSAVGHRVIDIVTENDITRLDHESTGNMIDDTSREAFFVSSRGASQDFDISLTNNELGQVVPIGSTNREAIEMLSEDSSDMEAIVTNNLIAGNTSVLDQVVDIDIENTSFMDMRFVDNTVTNAQPAGGVEVVVDTENGTSTHCMVFTGNTAVDVEFDVNASPSGHRIENFASRVANNPGVSNFLDGAGVTDVGAGTCQQPDF